MRRTALAVAALLLAASPAFAAGAYVTRTVQDGSGAHVQSYWDESGVGTGPFDPVYQLPSGYAAGGGSGSSSSISNTGFAAYGPDAVGNAPSKPPVLVGLLDGSGNVRQVSPGYPMPISGTVTANLGTLNGVALDTSVQAVKTALGSPFQAGGSIGNTAFGISGQLPAFAAPPNVQLADGADATLGNSGQPASCATGYSLISCARQLHADLLGATFGTATTSAPSYANGATAALSLNLAGGLRVDGSGVTQPISAAALPLPSGAATAANQTAVQSAAGAAASTLIGIQGNASGVPVPVNVNNTPTVQGVSTYYPKGSEPALGSQGYTPLNVDLHGRARIAETGSDDAVVGMVPTVGGGSFVAKASAGNLYRAYAIAQSAPSAQQYIVCINATSVPSAGAAISPVDFAPFNLATTAGATASINFGPGPPSYYSTGITCLISTSLVSFNAGNGSPVLNVAVR